MAHVIVVSSWVAHGHVGLCAAVPVLNALGHRVTQLPTVQLSNHAGWPHVSGGPVPVDTLAGMVEALDRNGWLSQADAILTGYLPSAAHVDFAAGLIDRLRAATPALRITVDPVLGDAPKGLYIAPEAAVAIRDLLLPRADLVTPNHFELSWLTGDAPETLAETATTARRLMDQASAGGVFVTSPPLGPPLGPGSTGLLALDRTGATLYRTARHASVPNGVGDVLSALIASGLPAGHALGHLQALIGRSLGADHLRIAETAPHWTAADPIAAEPFAALTGRAETG
jgi:pyridoxine kinase